MIPFKYKFVNKLFVNFFNTFKGFGSKKFTDYLPHFYVITELPGSSTVWHYVNNIVGTLVWQFSKVDKQNLLIHLDRERYSVRPVHKK